MNLTIALIGFAAVCTATAADAGDADAGRALAQSRCAPCHVTGPWRGDVFADAPPFEAIARRFGGDPTALIVALRGPHQKMNFRPSQREAEDIAAYISSLAR